jgi:small subunit ribosomal protein S9
MPKIESPASVAGGAQAAPAPVAVRPKPDTKGYIWGTGRRKTAVARVRVKPGTGAFLVNGKEMKDYFSVERQRSQAISPLVVTNTRSKVDVFVNVRGGGPFGQAGATVLGIARALLKMDGGFSAVLRAGGFLTRDAREVERKKYGRAGARRSFQFSKR